jgi:hypothetical protein
MSRRVRFPPSLGVLALYLALSLVFFGRPVLDAPDQVGVGSGNDPNLFMWMLAWWPHAIGHGLDPLYTHLLFAPGGFNLTWTTSIPGPGLLVAPITEAAGPIVAYNVLALLAPALSAFTAFLLCRHLTGRMWPSVVGGYIFGFSSYVIAALAGGHLHLSLVAMIPLCLLLVLRHVEGSLRTWHFVGLLSVCLIAQFVTSSEQLVLFTIFGGLALLVVLVFSEHRRRVARTAGLIALAYGVMAVVVSPLIYYTLFKSGTTPQGSPDVYAADLSNFVVPTPLTRFGSRHLPAISNTFRGNFTEQGAYLGIPLLVIVGLFAAARPKRIGDRALVVVFVAAGIMALGTTLHVSGVPAKVWMPWKVVNGLPLIHYALPARALAYVFLAAGLMVALWLAQRPSLGRSLVAALAVVSLVPDSGLFRYQQTYVGPHLYAPPRFITAGAYRRWIERRDRVLVIPFGDARGMQWQLRAHMGFVLVGGYVQHLPDAYLRWPIVNSLLTNTVNRDAGPDLRRFMAAKRVTVILVSERHPGPWPGLLRRMGLTPTRLDGVLFYRLRPPGS